MQEIRIPKVVRDDYHQGKYLFQIINRDAITISTQIDMWSQEWKMKLPEMIYGDNSLTITLIGCDHKLLISPQHILRNRCLETEFDPLKITFDGGDLHPEIPVHSDGYHWAFPSFAGASGYEQSLEIPSSERIPYDLLSKRDPILWHKTILLYEDDLHDFGYIVEECRIRVMETYFYVLLQCYLRIDRRCIFIISHRYFGVSEEISKTVLHDFSVQKFEWSQLPESQCERQLFEDVHNVNKYLDKCMTVEHRVTQIVFDNDVN